MSDYLDHFDRTDEYECEECEDTGYAGTGGVDVMEIYAWICSCPAGERARQEEQDEFFAQDVATGPFTTQEIKQREKRYNMTEPEQRVVRLSFERVIRPADYESARAGAEMTCTLPPGATLQQAAELFEDEFIVLKGAVLGQLGLAFEYEETEDMKVIREVFPDSKLVAHPSRPAAQHLTPVPNEPPANPFAGTPFTPNPAAVSAPFAAPEAAAPVAQMSDKQAWDELVQDLTVNQGNAQEWWDNRATKTGKQPDFRKKYPKGDPRNRTAKGLWLNSVPAEYAHLFGA